MCCLLMRRADSQLSARSQLGESQIAIRYVGASLGTAPPRKLANRVLVIAQRRGTHVSPISYRP